MLGNCSRPKNIAGDTGYSGGSLKIAVTKHSLVEAVATGRYKANISLTYMHCTPNMYIHSCHAKDAELM